MTLNRNYSEFNYENHNIGTRLRIPYRILRKFVIIPQYANLIFLSFILGREMIDEILNESLIECLSFRDWMFFLLLGNLMCSVYKVIISAISENIYNRNTAYDMLIFIYTIEIKYTIVSILFQTYILYNSETCDMGELYSSWICLLHIATFVSFVFNFEILRTLKIFEEW